MTNFFRFVLVWTLVVLVFDLLASLVSLFSGISYGWFAIGSVLIYGSIGYQAAPVSGLRRATSGAILVAAVDGTLGWWISWSIGPGRTPDAATSNLLFMGSTLISMLIFGGVVGLLGAGLSLKRRSKRDGSLLPPSSA